MQRDTTNEMMAQMRQASALIVEAEGATGHAKNRRVKP